MNPNRGRTTLVQVDAVRITAEAAGEDPVTVVMDTFEVTERVAIEWLQILRKRDTRAR